MPVTVWPAFLGEIMKKSTVVLSSLGVAAGSAVTAAAAVMKKKNICPRCEIKKFIASKHMNYSNDEYYNNGVCLTPPMGWSSWNAFRNKIDENIILDMAKAMKATGLSDYGYTYINLDDCWHSSMRDENGRLQGDLTTFPHGIKWLVDEIGKLGLKTGIYSSNGILTCEDLPASQNHERTDAETFADWGVQYFKYDFCHNVPLSNEAPYVDSITIGGNGIDNELVFKASDGVLTGEAKLVEEDGGSYVRGLDSNLGTLTFRNVTVNNDGEYVLTLVMRKRSGKEKFCQITVNGTDKYDLLAPETKAFSREGRVQVCVRLKKGENTVMLKNPVASSIDSAAVLYEKMGRELKRATKLYAEKNGCEEKPILYSICEWGKNRPWKWGGKAGNIWRTTYDIAPTWTSMLSIYEINVRLDKYARPGAFNDPDMLEVGNGKLTYEENKAQFSLWCMMAAPLILGNDLRKLLREDGTADTDSKIYQILTNRDLIALDQDKRGIQCKRIKTNAVTDVLVKPLENNEVAVCFFNKGPVKATVSCSLQDIHNVVEATLPKADCYNCTELWDKETSTVTDCISADVEAHGVKVFRIFAEK